MNVFVTGATGFVGRRLVKILSVQPQIKKVYCLTRREGCPLPKSCEEVNGTLENIGALGVNDVDVCIHLAAITNTDPKKCGDIHKVNVEGTANTVSFCRANGIRRIVFISSVNVYLQGGFGYAQSKREGEKIVNESGLETVILRSAYVYGEGCETFEKILRFVKLFHAVPVLGGGNAHEQPVYVDELCRRIAESAFAPEVGVTYDVYGKTDMTYREMVKKLAAAQNEKVALICLPKKPFEVAAAFCARHKIGFPISPEQISHMCEDLRGEPVPGAEDFEVNLKKYM